MTADEVVELAAQLPKYTQRNLLRKLSEAPLSDKERAFVREYTVDFNKKRAARVAGYSRPYQNAWNLLNSKHFERVQTAVEQRMEEMEAKSELKAEYVRQYIMSILELCPTDYFVMGPDGHWMIEPDDFKRLPHEVRRLVDGVETRVVKGAVYYSVKFVSKQTALALAARFTLLSNEADGRVDVPWDEIQRSAKAQLNDAVEERIKMVEAQVRETD